MPVETFAAIAVSAMLGIVAAAVALFARRTRRRPPQRHAPIRQASPIVRRPAQRAATGLPAVIDASIGMWLVRRVARALGWRGPAPETEDPLASELPAPSTDEIAYRIGMPGAALPPPPSAAARSAASPANPERRVAPTPPMSPRLRVWRDAAVVLLVISFVVLAGGTLIPKPEGGVLAATGVPRFPAMVSLDISPGPTLVAVASASARPTDTPAPPTPAPSASPTPSASPSPTASPTPTVRPTAPPTARPTPPPTLRPTPTPTPKPTPTPVPPPTPTPTPTPVPPPTPTPTPTPVPPPIITDFSASPTSGSAPLTVHFTGSAANATSWTVTFGDGSSVTGSGSVSVDHVYLLPGSYIPSLTVSGPGGSDEEPANLIDVGP